MTICPHCGSPSEKMKWYVNTKLTEREKMILNLRTFAHKDHKLTYRELSDTLGISPQRVHQIEQMAVKKAEEFANTVWEE